jgi:hypothetical protein
MSDGAFAKKYVDGIYIPSALLVVGCVIVKREWAPYAVVVALLLSGYKLWSSSESPQASADDPRNPSEVITNTISRSPESTQAHGVPELRAQGEDHHLAQCSNVSIPCPLPR